MESIGVLMTSPMYTYLEQQLETRFHLIKLWQLPSNSLTEFFETHKNNIKAIVANTKIGADAKLIDSMPSLEIVATFSVGVDKIDLKKCAERGVRVVNTPDVLTDDVADLAIGLVLNVLRKISACDQYVKCGKWGDSGDFALTTKFSGKPVGIVGLGRIGTAIAKRAEAFNCSISYHSRSQKPNANYKHYSNITELARDCQILIVACALTQETYHIIDREVIHALGPEGILINIGRGALVDEPELVSALLKGQLAGAGLDVYEHEPEAPKELFELDNVVLLPHVGTDTVETSKAMADLVMANLDAYFSNRPLLSPVV